MQVTGSLFTSGDNVILVDRKNREYYLKLTPGKVTDIRGGKIPHESIIGQEEGVAVISSIGEKFFAFKPALSQFILNMPRKGQIIYPKDTAIILMWADVFPGAKVVEGGIGSGALTLALLRAVGEKGRVISYEIRKDFASQARENIERFMGKVNNLSIKIKDIYQGIEEREVDRVILDVPEPWNVVDHAVQALKSGGFFLSYIPTATQVKRVVDKMRESGAFTSIQAIEVLVRPWNVNQLSLRPVHRMVAHTGFIVVGRKLVIGKFS